MKKTYVKFFSCLFVVLFPATVLAHQTSFYELNINMLQSLHGVVDDHMMGTTTTQESKLIVRGLQIEYLKNVQDMVRSGQLQTLRLTPAQVLEINNSAHGLFVKASSSGYCLITPWDFAVGFFFIGMGIEDILYGYAPAGVPLIAFGIVCFAIGVYSLFECLAG